MKQLFFFILFLLVLAGGEISAQETKIVFLHHSTGRLIYQDGNVADSIQAYNEQHGTKFLIEEREFPDKPYKWANYPYDYWNIWLNGLCEQQKGKENYRNVVCLDDLCKEYDVIIIKHCYPGADIREDTGNPDITSDRKKP